MKLKNQQGITTFWGIFIILMESVIVVFIFYILYFFWIENPTPTSNILIIRTFTKKAVTIPKSVDTADWLKYINNSYGFSIQYPSDYQATEDEIIYGDYDGKIISLTKGDIDDFSVRIFKIKEEESVADSFERLTGVSPSIYQSFSEKVDDHDAIVYRQEPGDAAGDRIYFMGNNYLFESAFDQFSIQILATFEFL